MNLITVTLATAPLVLIGFVRHAAAQPNSEATAADHFQRGLVHAQASEIDAAATEFEAAYEASPNYSVLYNLGRTYLVLGRAVDASETLTRYLTEGGVLIDSKRRAEVERIISQCEKRIGQLQLSELPTDATVEIDGKPPRSRTSQLRLVVGAHAVVVSAPGFRSTAQAFAIVAGKTTLVRVELEAVRRPDRAISSVFVSCPMSDVMVFIDESPAGITPIEKPLSVTTGRHQFSFRRPGYLPADMAWTSGSSATIDCALRVEKPLRSNASTLYVDTSEQGAQVFVDGAPRAEPSLPFGKHRIEVRKFGFRNWTRDVYLHPGEVERLALTLVPLPEYISEMQRQARSRRLIGYGIAGAGSAFLVTAGALALASSHAYADWRDLHDALATTPVTDPGYAAMQDAATRKAIRIQALDTWTLSSAIVGSLALIGGAAIVLSSANPAAPALPTVNVTSDAWNLEWHHAF